MNLKLWRMGLDVRKSYHSTWTLIPATGRTVSGLNLFEFWYKDCAKPPSTVGCSFVGTAKAVADAALEQALPRPSIPSYGPTYPDGGSLTMLPHGSDAGSSSARSQRGILSKKQIPKLQIPLSSFQFSSSLFQHCPLKFNSFVPSASLHQRTWKRTIILKNSIRFYSFHLTVRWKISCYLFVKMLGVPELK